MRRRELEEFRLFFSAVNGYLLWGPFPLEAVDGPRPPAASTEPPRQRVPRTSAASAFVNEAKVIKARHVYLAAGTECEERASLIVFVDKALARLRARWDVVCREFAKTQTM
jgi:hypothetical protein